MAIGVLLADDEEVILEGMKLLLENMDGIKVLGEAKDGIQAVLLSRKLRPDVVIMDIVMPNLNGVDATRKIISENPHIRVIAFSMHSDWSWITKIFDAGAEGYLPKECMFNKSVLQEELHHLLFYDQSIFSETLKTKRNIRR